jgi:hypothetical protein
VYCRLCVRLRNWKSEKVPTKHCKAIIDDDDDDDDDM